MSFSVQRVRVNIPIFPQPRVPSDFLLFTLPCKDVASACNVILSRPPRCTYDRLQRRVDEKVFPSDRMWTSVNRKKFVKRWFACRGLECWNLPLGRWRRALGCNRGPSDLTTAPRFRCLGPRFWRRDLDCHLIFFIHLQKVSSIFSLRLLGLDPLHASPLGKYRQRAQKWFDTWLIFWS
jgi:hypothetical protein